jgi:hypothetical protein
VRWPLAWEFANWNNALVVGRSPASTKVSTEAEDIVEICHQATTDENTED